MITGTVQFTNLCKCTLGITKRPEWFGTVGCEKPFSVALGHDWWQNSLLYVTVIYKCSLEKCLRAGCNYNYCVLVLDKKLQIRYISGLILSYTDVRISGNNKWPQNEIVDNVQIHYVVLCCIYCPERWRSLMIYTKIWSFYLIKIFPREKKWYLVKINCVTKMGIDREKCWTFLTFRLESSSFSWLQCLIWTGWWTLMSLISETSWLKPFNMVQLLSPPNSCKLLENNLWSKLCFFCNRKKAIYRFYNLTPLCESKR